MNPLPPRVAIVLDDQLALGRLQTLQAAVEAVEPLLAQHHGLVRLERDDASPRGVGRPRLVEADMLALPADVLKQDITRHDVAVARGRRRRDVTGLLQRAADAIQRFVGEFVGGRAITSIEILYQTASHLEVRLALRFGPVVQPFEQAAECEFRNYWLFS